MPLPSRMKELLLEKKKINSQLSLRWLAERMGVSSGRLSEILNGKRPLKDHYLEKFCVALKLTDDETHQFRREFQKPEKAKKVTDSFGPVLSEAEINAFSDWKAFAFMSYLQTKLYDGVVAKFSLEEDQHKAIAEQFKLTVEEVKTLAILLVNLKLIEWRDCRYSPVYSEATTGFDIPSDARRTWHRKHLELAQRKFQELDVMERDFSVITFTMDEANLLKGKKMIRNFRRNFSRVMEAKKGDGVYQLSVQLFPIVKSEKEIV